MIQNISSGRKVFKFMKFIDEYKAFMQLVQKMNNQSPKKLKEKIVQFLSLLTKFSGIFYNMLDNIVWIANMGAIPQ